MKGSSELEGKITNTLAELKASLKELKTEGLSSSGGSSGLSEKDKNFLKELSNDTRDAITDMRLEVLTASDKSKN